jgi:FkbM family methyltransferase
MSHSSEENDIRGILMARRNPDKSAILDTGERTVIYGAGGTGRRVLALLKKHGIMVDYFLDEKGGSNIFIDDVPVLKPNDPAADKTAKVIVALFNHKTDIMPVMALLKRNGFMKVVPYTEVFIHFADELPVQYWLGQTDVYEAKVPDITDALSMFEDLPSRDLFLSFLKFRVTGDPTCMPRPDRENIYFPADVRGTRKPDHFIDCGAFDGDTLLSVRERFGVLESIRAFEPDPENFRKLVVLNTQARRERRPFSKDTVLSPCGVWSSTVQIRFASDGSIASGVSEHGDTTVQCVAIDEFLDGYTPTFIKMDIEGSELNALNGCRRMIASAKLDLAVSVYHVPDHLWKIPLLIRELRPGCRCYLRSHGYNGYDTVFYAYQSQ